MTVNYQDELLQPLLLCYRSLIDESPINGQLPQILLPSNLGWN